jgi:thiamine-monophosphate kinase
MRLNEFNIIDRIANQFPRQTKNYLGIGDDAAAIFQPPNVPFLITQDLLIEDVHFRLSYFTPEALAHKTLQVNLSDIAAMGGRSQYALLGLSIPDHLSSDWLARFLNHLTKLCQTHKVIIIGGDTTKSPDKFYISLTLIGIADGNIKLRSQAQVGDIICVTGNLGDAYAGLLALEQNIMGLDVLKNKLLMPNAKITEGIVLGKAAGVTAMLDISDGLYIDLENLCRASSVGACIDTEMLPVSSELVENIHQITDLSPLQMAIHGGEDYELLCTIDADVFSTIQAQCQLYPIGYITADKSICYLQNGQKIDPQIIPYSHFPIGFP